MSPSLRAWPPICMSCGPQGVPGRSSFRPQLSIVHRSPCPKGKHFQPCREMLDRRQVLSAPFRKMSARSSPSTGIELRARQRAERVAGETLHLEAARGGDRPRVPQIGGGEQVRLLAAEDALAQPAGRAEAAFDSHSAFPRERLSDIRHCGFQAARGKEPDRRSRVWPTARGEPHALPVSCRFWRSGRRAACRRPCSRRWPAVPPPRRASR